MSLRAGVSVTTGLELVDLVVFMGLGLMEAVGDPKEGVLLYDNDASPLMLVVKLVEGNF